MSRQMKLLMENFNKFIEEEVDMEEEMGTKGNLDSAIDSVLDDILDDALMETILKEFGPVSAEDMAEFEGSGEAPSKEDIKSGIKQVVKSSEGQKAAVEIEQMAGAKPDIKDYVNATKNAIQNGALKGLGIFASTVPMFGVFGAMIGGELMTPHHSHSSWLNDPQVVQQAIDSAQMVGGTSGAVVGSILLAMALAFVAHEIKKNAEDLADGTPKRNIRFPRLG